MNPVDEYIAGFPQEVQPLLQQIRQVIRTAAPDAEECIRWGMATYKQCGNVVHFAGCKKHIGFYPGDSGVAAFQEELSGYHTTKGGIQLPLNRPLPVDLITRIVTYRVVENKELAEGKKKKCSPNSIK